LSLPYRSLRNGQENGGKKKIVIYSVACEPALGNYKNARAFFKGISEITSGRYLSLGNAHLLPQVIVGGSAEEIDLKKFEEEVLKEKTSVTTACPTLSSEEVEDRVTSNLAHKGIKTWQLDITHQAESIPNTEYIFSSPSLADARVQMKPSPVKSAPPPTASYATQSAHYHQSPISKGQVSKVLKRNNE